MKKYAPYICMFTLFCLLFSGCSTKKSLSEDAQAVLDATMNTPNAELFNPDIFIYPGMDEEAKEQAQTMLEEIENNWEILLGQYFSPGSFDPFLNSYIRSRFFADDPLPSKLVSTELISKDDTQEVVEAQVYIDGQVSIFKVTFRRNPDGLLYRVDIEEMQ